MRGEGFLQKHRKIYVMHTQLEEPGACSCFQTNSRKDKGERKEDIHYWRRETWAGGGVGVGPREGGGSQM